MKALLATVALVLIAILILKQAPAELAIFQDVDIVFDPELDPYTPEKSPNDNCMNVWDYYQPQCDLRLVSVI